MKDKIVAFGLVLVFLLSASVGMASAFSFGDFTEKQSNIAILVLDHDNLGNVEGGFVDLIKNLGYSPKVIGIDQVKAGSVDLSDHNLIIVPTYGTANVKNAYSSDVVERGVIKATNSGTNWILAQSGSIILKKLGLTTIKAGEPPGWIPALADSTFAVNAITSSPITEDVPTMPDFPGGYSLDDLDSRDLPSLIWRVDPNERSRYVWLNIDEIKIEPSYLLNVAGTGWHIGKPHPGLPEWKVGDTHILYFHHLWNVDPGNGGDGYIGQAGLKLLNNAIKCYSKVSSTIKPTPTPPSPESLFRVTAGKYSETADLGDVIKNEFGDNYRLADWNDILVYSDDIQSWAKSIGMKQGDSYLVSRNGERFWSGKRHYFITRHDHNCPGNWLVHDHIDDHFVDLGSWYDMKKQVLCIKTTKPKPTPTTSTFEDDFSELNLDNWITFGSPFPRVLASVEGRNGIFDNNGDSWCNSGVVSKDTFSFPNGFTMESDIYLKVTDVTGCWDGAIIGLTKRNTIVTKEESRNCPGEDYPTGLLFGIDYDGDACWATPEEKREHAYFTGGLYTQDGKWESIGDWVNADDYINKWYNFKIVVGEDRYVKFYVDNELIYSSRNKLNKEVLEGKKIYLGHRSSGSAGKAYHDFIKVYTKEVKPTPTIPTPSPEMELLYQNKDDDGIWIEIYGPREPPLNSKVDYAVFITLAETERKSREGKGNIYDMFEGFVYIAYPDDYVNTYPGDELLTKILYENEEQWYSQNIAEGLKKHEGGMEVVNILMSVACKIPGLWEVISNQILPSVPVPPKNSVFFDDNTHDILVIPFSCTGGVEQEKIDAPNNLRHLGPDNAYCLNVSTEFAEAHVTDLHFFIAVEKSEGLGQGFTYRHTKDIVIRIKPRSSETDSSITGEFIHGFIDWIKNIGKGVS